MFKDHHYLSGNISPTCRCFIGIWEGNIVAFGSSLAMPNGAMNNAWRAHRTVILPEYQGLGIGVAFSNAIAQLHIDDGYRYFSRTSHPRFGIHRNNSLSWKGTSKNMKLRIDIKNDKLYNNYYGDNKRICFSHEYIGNKKGE